MKRIRLLVLLGVIAVALPLGVVVAGNAGAAGSTRTTTSVSISQYADFNFAGTQLDVNLLVSCTSMGGLGVANVSVTQDRPEAGGTATGDGTNIKVVCDGKTHSTGVTVVGTIYDPGKALATAEVIAGSGTATTSKWITIKVV
jgi:hypothetical protein